MTGNTMIPWVRQITRVPSQIKRARGSFLFTNDNQKIIDFTAGAMAVNLGHGNKAILDSIVDNTENGISYLPINGFSTTTRNVLSSKILEFAGKNYSKVFYTNGGVDANESADFIAREYHKHVRNGRKKSLALCKSFHGGSTIAGSLMGGDPRREPKKTHYSLPFFPIIPNPLMSDMGEQSLSFTETQFRSGDVSSLMLEGSSGTAGCFLYPKGYLEQIRVLCDQYNVLLICDEVMSGWCRTGKVFAYQHSTIEPDIITTAKGITSGYAPLGAVILSKKIAEIFDDIPFMYGLTYSGHHLSCNVASTCMQLYEQNNFKLLDDVRSLSKILDKECNKIKDKTSFVTDFRLNGLLGCFELSLSEDHLSKLSSDLLANGVYCLRIRENLFVSPPLTINKQDMLSAVNIIDYTFENL